MKKLISTFAITALSLGALSACGSDDDVDVPGGSTPDVTNPVDDTVMETIDPSMTDDSTPPDDSTMTSDVSSTQPPTAGGAPGVGGSQTSAP